VRLDKWLWAARFFKTRSLASDAVDGGKVKLNGAVTKPAKGVKIGDRLHVRAGDQDWEVIVAALNEQRRPAAEAQLLYQETPESAQERTRAVEQRMLAPAPVLDHKGRPTKRERRALNRFRDQ
jgi:ribosome-associated heat shock protein Hsp15